MQDGPDELADLSDALDRVEAALERLDAGTYGGCEHCGEPIDGKTLEADAATTTCASCAQGRIAT